MINLRLVLRGDCPVLKLNNILSALFAALAVAGLAGAAEARTTPIDDGTDEVWGDADDGAVIALSAPVNYGSGLQNAVTVHFGNEYSGGGLNLMPVSLDFGNGASLFATLQVPSPGSNVVIISNPGENTSTPNHVINPASIFDFGSMEPILCCAVAHMGGVYGSFDPSAKFQLIDLSSSGSPGDFELLLSCTAMCTNIGFNLGGSQFLASDPSSIPPQLVSSSVTSGTFPGVTNGTWDFVFRNVSPVPEPKTWASMLVGFGLIGSAMRRKLKPCRA